MGELCGLCWGEEKCILDFGREKIKESTHLVDLDVDGIIILKLFVEK
jgi:hypothetical protein